MERTRNTNYGRGRGSGRGNNQDYQHQTGGRGRGGNHRGSHNQPRGRDPIGANQPRFQQAGVDRPQQQHQHPLPAGGRGAVWTGRPWGPSPPTPRAPAHPLPQTPMPAQPSADGLSIQNLQISDHKSLPSASDGKESRIQPIRRPDQGGTISVRTINLLVNHFPVEFDPKRAIFHYDVEVKLLSEDKRAAQRKMRRSDMRFIKEQLFANNPEFRQLVTAYDESKSLFSPVCLPEGHFTVNISEGEDTKSGSYQFTVKFVNKLELSRLKDYVRGTLSYVPRDVLQAMDLVMKENPSQRRVRVGRNFYAFSESEDLCGGLAACWGFQQSLKSTSQGAVLCLDYSVMPFRKPLPVIHFLEEHIPGFRIDRIRNCIVDVNEALKGLLVKVTHRRTNQKYTIAGLTKENACDVEFDLVDPEGQTRNIDLITYFKEKWNVEIKHKTIPCLELGKNNRSNKVPLEFCVLVVGQKYPKDYLDRDAAGKLKNFSLAKPIARKNNINGMVRAEDGPCGGGIAAEFGIEVDTNMTKVAARVLHAPQLKLQNSVVNVDREKRQWNLVGGKYLVDGKSVEHWGILEFVNDKRRYHTEQVVEFVNNLKDRANSLGMRMENPLSHVIAEMRDLSSVDKLDSLFREVIQKSGREKLELIVCAMTGKDNGYKNLKWVAETRLGVVTQCYLSRSAANKKGQDQYLANLCLKINAKLGGNNFEVHGKLLDLPNNDHVMFIGADVNHPAPMNTSCPSIAAVVGSVNWPAANRYAARVLPHQHRCERIINFGSMCMDLIDNYEKLNGVRPNRLVLFRDGVSDGQFDMALDEELHDLKKVCLDKGYNPRITLIVAQKRHQTRLFLENERDGGYSGNVPPGTVVDTDIVHPFEFDFYLCSHYGILGTSKPTHYYVLLDENSFSSNQLQKLIYNMCFLFARCTKPVSLVPPVYYADLAAYRGRMFQEAVENRVPPRTHASASASPSGGPSFDESLYKMHRDMENVMFFI